MFWDLDALCKKCHFRTKLVELFDVGQMGIFESRLKWDKAGRDTFSTRKSVITKHTWLLKFALEKSLCCFFICRLIL